MKLISPVRRRLNEIRNSISLSSRKQDWIGLTILALARHGLFERFGLLSKFARRLWPTLILRVNRMGNNPIVIDPADSSHVMIFDEIVIENVYDISKIKFEPDFIIDCGGHIGLFTALASAHFPAAKLIVFEPLLKNAALIDQMTRLNYLNVDIHRCAVGDHARRTTFYERMSFGGSLLNDYGGVLRSHQVDVIDFPAFVKFSSPKRLVLKMDVEGAEQEIFPKLIKVLPPQTAVFFETHVGPTSWEYISSLLLADGFKVELIRQRDPFRDGFAVR